MDNAQEHSAADAITSLRFTDTKPGLQWHIYTSLCTIDMDTDDFTRRRKYIERLLAHAKVGYTVNVSLGGYQYRDTVFAKELSLAFHLVDVPRRGIDYIAQGLCTCLGQESVLVTCEPVESYYLFNDQPGPCPDVVVEDAVRKRFHELLDRKTIPHLQNAYNTFSVMSRKAENVKGAPLSSVPTPAAVPEYQSTDCFTIYIGLEQRHAISNEETKLRAAQVVINTLRDNAIAYSVNIVYGGYEFEDGFFEQDSLQITLIGAREEDVRAVVQAMCVNTGQEIALVTKSKLNSEYLFVEQ